MNFASMFVDANGLLLYLPHSNVLLMALSTYHDTIDIEGRRNCPRLTPTREEL